MLKKKLIPALKRGLGIAKLVFTPIAIACLLYFAWNAKDQIAEISENIKAGWLIGSFILWSGLHFLSPIFTIRLFAALSSKISYLEAFLIHSRRLPAKYLPGGIWHSVARATDYHSYGFSKKNVGIYLLLENILAAFVTLMIGAAAVSMLSGLNTTWATVLQAAVLAGLGILLLLPWSMNKLATDSARPTMGCIYQSIFCLTIYWFIAALSFVCFINGIPGLEIGVTDLEAGGIYIFSWGVGFIALFAPQGIGISEFVSAKLLNSGLSAQSFVVVLASFRLVSLAGDLFVWLMSLLAIRRG